MLTEQTVISHIGILEDGQIQIRRSRRIFDGSERVAEQYHRAVLEPGQDISRYPVRVQVICAAVWTPEVIAAYQARKTASA